MARLNINHELLAILHSPPRNADAQMQFSRKKHAKIPKESLDDGLGMFNITAS